MDWKDKSIPLSPEQQQALLNKVVELERNEKKLSRKLKHLEHDREYINVLYENEVRLRDFNEREKDRQYLYNKLLLDNSPTFLIVLSPDLRYVIGTSKLLCENFGFADALELNDLPLQDIFSGNAAGPWLEQLADNCARVLECRVTLNYAEQINFATGRNMHVSINLSPVIDAEANVQGVLFIMHDLTELFYAKEKAEIASEAKSYFLTNVSHEIRTPMNAIRGMSNLLNKTAMSEVQKDYVKNILTASDSLLQIINDILDFSKLDAKEMKLVLGNYSLSELIYDVTNVTSLKAAEKGLVFVTDIDPGLPQLLVGDEVRVKQMMLNILDNAVKFTKEGFVKFSLDYLRQEQGILLKCAITDSGIGIADELTENLFEAFGHIDIRKKHDIQGIGLGLTISKNLAKAMGGDIMLESSPQQGSTFTLLIPQQVADAAPLAQITEPGKKRVLLLGNSMASNFVEKMLKDLFVTYDYISDPEQILAALEKNSYTHLIYWYNLGQEAVRRYTVKLNNVELIAVKDLSMISLQDTDEHTKTIFEPVLVTTLAELLNEAVHDQEESVGVFKALNVRALLVDDNEINLLVAEELLRHYDIEVDCAQSGQEALQYVEKCAYDIIFMDHMMPGMDGIETTCKIRQLNEWGAKVPIIALTANAVLGIRQFFIDNRLDDYVSKPIEIKELNNVLKKWLPPDKLDLQAEPIESIEQTAPPEQSEFFTQLHVLCGLDVENSVHHLGGNKETYKSLLEIFVSRAQENRQRLMNFYYNNNWEDFRILVHSYKSTFHNIGAKGLSEESRKLEVATIKENYEYIKASFSEFVTQMEKLETQLAEMLQQEQQFLDKPAAGAQEQANLSALLDCVGELVDGLESDAALEQLAAAMQVSYGKEVDEALHSLKSMIESFDYDEVPQYIEEIKGKLAIFC